METLLSHPLYLAPVPLYAQLYAADALVVDDISPFVKQTYRSRAVIAAESGAQQLTIPVIHDGGRVAMRDVRISEHGNWRHQHWNALVTMVYFPPDSNPLQFNGNLPASDNSTPWEIISS